MTKTQTHIIKKQVLDLQLFSKEGAFEQQTAFRDLFMQKLLPQLSDFFDEIAPPGVTLIMDHLEVDLGEVDFTKTDEHSLKMMAEKMKQSLTKQIGDLNPSTKSVVKPTVLKGIRLLVFFLENGYLPWWQTHLSSADFEKEILADLKKSTTAMRQLMQVFFKKTVSTASKEQVLFKRFVYQFSDQIIAEVLRGVFEQKKLINPSVKTPALRLKQWKKTVLNLLESPREIVQKETTLGALKKEQHATQKEKTLEGIDIFNNQKTAKIPSEKEVKSSIEREEIVLKKKASSNDGYYIKNSGLVIIAPYLDHFFTALNLMKDQKFINEATQIRAMHLLQYLATFEEDAPEYGLILNKILCGIPLEEPVLKSVELSTTEKEEARNLLEAVVRNWPALKNTSPEGLQEGFLQREGKLIQKKATGKWLLQVEGKTHDILLGKLPWTYSMIKQSWMPSMLTVEWL